NLEGLPAKMVHGKTAPSGTGGGGFRAFTGPPVADDQPIALRCVPDQLLPVKKTGNIQNVFFPYDGYLRMVVAPFSQLVHGIVSLGAERGVQGLDGPVRNGVFLNRYVLFLVSDCLY